MFAQGRGKVACRVYVDAVEHHEAYRAAQAQHIEHRDAADDPCEPLPRARGPPIAVTVLCALIAGAHGGKVFLLGQHAEEGEGKCAVEGGEEVLQMLERGHPLECAHGERAHGGVLRKAEDRP